MEISWNFVSPKKWEPWAIFYTTDVDKLMCQVSSKHIKSNGPIIAAKPWP